jgi:hypothetical protein
VVKLITVQAETAAMHEWVASNSPELVSSDLLHAELLRAGQRIGIADTLAVAEALDAPLTRPRQRGAAPCEPSLSRSASALRHSP